MHALTLLREMGLDPKSDEARRAIALVRDRVTWSGCGPPEADKNAFFAGAPPARCGQIAKRREEAIHLAYGFLVPLSTVEEPVRRPFIAYELALVAGLARFGAEALDVGVRHRGIVLSVKDEGRWKTRTDVVLRRRVGLSRAETFQKARG